MTETQAQRRKRRLNLWQNDTQYKGGRQSSIEKRYCSWIETHSRDRYKETEDNYTTVIKIGGRKLLRKIINWANG